MTTPKKESSSIAAVLQKVNGKKSKIKDITISLGNQNEQLNMSVYLLNQLPKDNPTAAKLGDIKSTINLTAKNDEVQLGVTLGNTDKVRNEGTIRVVSKLSQYKKLPKWLQKLMS